MKFSGKTVLVTGGARRLGMAACRAFSREGADIVIHYHSAAGEAEKLAEELRAGEGRAIALHADLSSAKEAERLIPRAEEAGFSPDILINSASQWAGNSLPEISWNELEASLRLSAFAPLTLTRAFAADREEPGAVVNLLDARIADYDRHHLSYHLSKRVLSDLTRLMAVEYAPLVRVNGLAPGIILPPQNTGAKQMEGFRRGNLLQRIGTVDEYLEGLLLLAGNEFITGQILYIDGGRSLRGRMYE